MTDIRSSTSVRSLDSTTADALECLAATQELVARIGQGMRFIHRGADSAVFLDYTVKNWLDLLRACKKFKQGDHGHALHAIELAMADALEPIQFREDVVLTAHGAAHMIGVNIETEYSDVASWDETEAKSGKPYAEWERLRDCRRLAKKVVEVTPDLVRGLRNRIEAERIRAERFLLAQTVLGTGPETPVTPGRGVAGKRKRMTKEEANIRAREALSNRKINSLRKLAKAIGCSTGLAAILPAWLASDQRKRSLESGGKPKRPRAVALTEPILATEGSEDAELERLMAEHTADFEQSPLVSDARKHPRRRRTV